ncbi:MAG: hypothetical protein KIT43_14795 [Bauldia sp.]|nr:hypothetical protein [Bauldia sp.]MCW5718180.1 hypothetical protein [Bauldia sp.]
MPPAARILADYRRCVTAVVHGATTLTAQGRHRGQAQAVLISLRQFAEFQTREIAARHPLLPSSAAPFDKVFRPVPALRHPCPDEVTLDIGEPRAARHHQPPRCEAYPPT